jgi:hypothetical protein
MPLGDFRTRQSCLAALLEGYMLLALLAKGAFLFQELRSSPLNLPLSNDPSRVLIRFSIRAARDI